MVDQKAIQAGIFLGLILFIVLISYLVLIYGVILFNYAAVLVVALFIMFYLFNNEFLLKLKEYERAVIFRFGKFSRVGGPGWVFLIPGIESYQKVTLRTEMVDVPRQDVITTDKVELNVDAVIYIKVTDPKAAVLNVEDYKQASITYAVSALRDVAGNMSLDEVLTNIEKINKKLSEGLKDISKKWGIAVRVEIKDINIPKEVLDAMQSAKAALKRAQAMEREAQGKKAQIEAIKSATKDLSNETIIYYYLQALEKLAEGRASKLIVPMELTRLTNFLSGKLQGKPVKETPEIDALLEKYAKIAKEKGLLDEKVAKKVTKKEKDIFEE